MNLIFYLKILRDLHLGGKNIITSLVYAIIDELVDTSFQLFKKIFPPLPPPKFILTKLIKKNSLFKD